MANPSDAESIKSYIVKNEGAVSGLPGSTYLLSQKFEFNWTVLGEMDKVRYMSAVNKRNVFAFCRRTRRRARSAGHARRDSHPSGVIRARLRSLESAKKKTAPVL